MQLDGSAIYLFVVASIITQNVVVNAQTETVQLVTSDYNEADAQEQRNITFCKNTDYTIVLECLTTSSSPAQRWNTSISSVTHTFTDSSSNGMEVPRDGFNFVLIYSYDSGNLRTYLSQLRVNTSTLSNAMETQNNMKEIC